MPHAGLMWHKPLNLCLKFHYKYSRKYVLTYTTGLKINLLYLEETMPNSALERFLEKQSLIFISAELSPKSQKMNLCTKARCQDYSPDIKSCAQA